MRPMELIDNYRLFTRHFNRREYPLLFSRYRSETAPFFDALEPSRIRAEAEELLDALAASWAAHRFRFRREAVMEEDKLLLALYLLPAAVAHGSDAASAFAQELARQWNARWPASPLRIGTFEALQKGFSGSPVRLSWGKKEEET